MTDEAEKSRVGEVIGGRYRLDHLLGKGGQGHVFAATDLQDGEAVAVKTLSGPRAADPEWRERMFREARAMVSLAGTSAVRVLDQKWSDHGELCLILERLHGRDFEDYLSELEESRRRFGLGELVDLLTPVADTLESAHAAGILHRDLKPSNIFIADDGRVRLLDFGFAKFISLRGLTRVGHVAGSPSYIAPEAWGGQPDQLDARVDVYGLAAVVFRALTGRPPFQAAKVYDLYRMVTEAKRPSLHQLRPDLPEDIDAWVEQALAIDPEQRFSRVAALWRALGSIAARASLAPGDTELLEPDDQPTPIDLPSFDVLSLDDSGPRAARARRPPVPKSEGAGPATIPSGEVVSLLPSVTAPQPWGTAGGASAPSELELPPDSAAVTERAPLSAADRQDEPPPSSSEGSSPAAPSAAPEPDPAAEPPPSSERGG